MISVVPCSMMIGWWAGARRGSSRGTLSAQTASVQGFKLTFDLAFVGDLVYLE